ncbi:MAG: hypothetical protein FWD92_02235 [Methanomassiliicoccaceae archaeon]|nr:hypothetical protein [Methanomassiliicoccaceae archaeon]
MNLLHEITLPQRRRVIERDTLNLPPFEEYLRNALLGDLTGWTLDYELSGGLRRHTLIDHNKDIGFDAYEDGKLMRIYGPYDRVHSMTLEASA